MTVKPPSMKARLSGWLRRNQSVAYAIFATFVGIMICVPIALGFFADDLGDVYDKFPDSTTKPIPFAFSFPNYKVTVVFTLVLFLVIWPAIGLLNAVISKPKNSWRALFSGIRTAAILALIFYVLVGWFIVIQSVDNYSRDVVAVLAESTWQPDGVTPEAAIDQANDLYGGLDEIPLNERAAAVAKRIRADYYASVPYAFLVGFSIAFVFSIPIVYGTMLGALLAKRRNPGWLFLLRYVIGWWAVTFSAVLAIPLTFIALGKAKHDFLFSIPAMNLTITFSITTLIAYFVLRSWRKNSPAIQS